jgi:hypothetical protein
VVDWCCICKKSGESVDGIKRRERSREEKDGILPTADIHSYTNLKK